MNVRTDLKNSMAFLYLIHDTSTDKWYMLEGYPPEVMRTLLDLELAQVEGNDAYFRPEMRVEIFGEPLWKRPQETN